MQARLKFVLKLHYLVSVNFKPKKNGHRDVLQQ